MKIVTINVLISIAMFCGIANSTSSALPSGSYEIRRFYDDKASGQVSLTISDSAITLENFILSEGHYFDAMNRALNAPVPDSGDKYSVEYGEREIARFALLTMPGKTFTLKRLGKNQFGLRYERPDVDELNNIDIRLILEDKHIELYLEYPYGKSTKSIGVSATYRFLLQPPH